MKNSILILSICFSLIAATSSAKSDKESQLTIQVKLVTDLAEEQTIAYCGIMIIYSTYEFEVLKVIQGEYEHKNIHIRISCPRETIELGDLKTGGIYTYQVEELNAIDSNSPPEITGYEGKLFRKINH